tara:strand:- start:205 stop:480 length:276 start_codon:yes stop_codon:yes gene_type:complete
MRKLLIIALIIFITSCSQPITQENSLFCETDNDCEVKNVGNCCGYYPGCVNKDYEPNLTKVQQDCFEQGIASVCGWTEIESCTCINNQCTQ